MAPGDSTVLFRKIASLHSLRADEKRLLQRYARQLMAEIGNGCPFTCLLTSNEELRRLNCDFRSIDEPTDVLSFPALEGSVELGEIAISVERAAQQAATYGHTRLQEIQILMLHGLLHLIGLDHDRDHGEMAQIEEQWRERLDLPCGLIERSVEVA